MADKYKTKTKNENEKLPLNMTKKGPNNTNNTKAQAQVQVVIRKKSIDNGDLSKYIPKNLMNTTTLKTTPVNRIKPLTITQKREKEEKEFVTSFQTVKSGQENLEKGLKSAPFDKNNKNGNLNIFQRLPKEIEDNEELAKMLLKNPDDMTVEEKIYISSLNKEEFKRFVQFLKKKGRELSWRGNDWGSGHYSEHYINIYRQTGHSENELYLSLRKFLKLNYNNYNAKKDFSSLNQANNELGLNNNRNKNGNNNFIMENNFGSGDNLNPDLDNEFEDNSLNVKDNSIYSQKNSKYKFNQNQNKNQNQNHNHNQSEKDLYFSTNKEQEELRNKVFETTSKVILKELENFKNILLDHKNEVNLKKVETQNNIIFGDLERKANMMRGDLEKFKETKKDPNNTNTNNSCNDIEKIYENFKSRQRNLKEELKNRIEESSIIKKIQSYMERMKQSALDLVKKLDINALTGINLSVNMKLAKENFVRLKILDESEAESFCNTLKAYHGDLINNDYLVCILETYVPDNIHDVILNEAEDLSITEEDNLSVEDFDYDYFEVNSPNNNQEDEKRKKLLATKALQDFDFLIKKKSAVHIQRIFRGHSARRGFRIHFIYLGLLVNRLVRHMRRYTKLMRKIKDDSAHKITYLFRKYYVNKNMTNNLTKSTQKWLKEGKNLTAMPFSHKNKGRCALMIQRAWRSYKNRLMCENNHYCESCFLKFHLRGAKRNHSYLKIKSLFDEYKKKKEKISVMAGAYNELTIIKSYLERTNFNLYEVLQMWDFKKNNTILYKHLRDALSVRGFKFDSSVRDLVLSFALKFTLEDNKNYQNIDNVVINYESLWLELV